MTTYNDKDWPRNTVTHWMFPDEWLPQTQWGPMPARAWVYAERNRINANHALSEARGKVMIWRLRDRIALTRHKSLELIQP